MTVENSSRDFLVEPHSKRRPIFGVWPKVPPHPLFCLLQLLTPFRLKTAHTHTHTLLATHTTTKSHLPLFFNTPSISVFFHRFLEAFSVLFLTRFRKLGKP